MQAEHKQNIVNICQHNSSIISITNLL